MISLSVPLLKVLTILVLSFVFLASLLVLVEIVLAAGCRYIDTLDEGLPEDPKRLYSQSEDTTTEVIPLSMSQEDVEPSPSTSGPSSIDDADEHGDTSTLVSPSASNDIFSDDLFRNSTAGELWACHRSLESALDTYDAALSQLRTHIEMLIRDQAELQSLTASGSEVQGEGVSFASEAGMSMNMG